MSSSRAKGLKLPLQVSVRDAKYSDLYTLLLR